MAERVDKTSYTASEWSAGALNAGYDANPLRNVKGAIWVPVSDAHKYTYIGTGVAYGDQATTGCTNCYPGKALPGTWNACGTSKD